MVDGRAQAEAGVGCVQTAVDIDVGYRGAYIYICVVLLSGLYVPCGSISREPYALQRIGTLCYSYPLYGYSPLWHISLHWR